MSDDGRHGLTVIAFVGSVFSPYYAWARRRGRARADDHCAVNVALYGDAARRWAMTERGRGALERSPGSLRIGPSRLDWRDAALELVIDEIAAPLPARIRGRLRLVPGTTFETAYPLGPGGRHWWQPVAPCARIEVELEHPRLAWTGHAYHDANWGTEPLEAGFSGWHWSRASLPHGEAAVLYDFEPRGAPPTTLGLRFTPAGTVHALDPPPRSALPATGWRIGRVARSDPDRPAQIVATLEDTPFYARSMLRLGIAGQEATAVHESLSLERFRRPLVQAMLPFRMPRRAGRG